MALVAIAVVLVAIVGRELKGGRSLAEWRQAIRLPAGPAQPPTEYSLHRCIVDGVVVYEGPDECEAHMPTFTLAPPPSRPIDSPQPQAAPAPGPKLTDYQREMLRSADARIARDEANARAEMMAMRRQAAPP